MIQPRVIPTLLIQNGDLVKTKRFSNPRYLGDPINAIRIFNEKYADELCVLDITASKEKKEPDFDLLEKIASEAFMPLSYGGGICNIDQIKRLFRIGYEKVVLNSEAMQNSGLIEEASEYFGMQSIVGAIDYKKTLTGYSCYICGGSKKVKDTPWDVACRYVGAGAGELLLYSINNDGMRSGYDVKLIEKISSMVNVPVIACGGANTLADMRQALDAGAGAVAAGSMFVFWGERQAVLINYPKEEEMIKYGVHK